MLARHSGSLLSVGATRLRTKTVAVRRRFPAQYSYASGARLRARGAAIRRVAPLVHLATRVLPPRAERVNHPDIRGSLVAVSVVVICWGSAVCTSDELDLLLVFEVRHHAVGDVYVYELG